MTTTNPRSGREPKAAESYYFDGPTVLVPARVAARMRRTGQLSKWRTQANEMGDGELYNVLTALHVAAITWESNAGAPLPLVHTPPVRAERNWVSTAQAATITGLTQRGVREACKRGRLKAERVGGQWSIDTASAKQYRAH